MNDSSASSDRTGAALYLSTISRRTSRRPGGPGPNEASSALVLPDSNVALPLELQTTKVSHKSQTPVSICRGRPGDRYPHIRNHTSQTACAFFRAARQVNGNDDELAHDEAGEASLKALQPSEPLSAQNILLEPKRLCPIKGEPSHPSTCIARLRA